MVTEQKGGRPSETDRAGGSGDCPWGRPCERRHDGGNRQRENYTWTAQRDYMERAKYHSPNNAPFEFDELLYQTSTDEE